MRKNWRVILLLFVSISLLIEIGFLIYNQAIKPSFRYDTAEEAFRKANGSGVEIADVLTEADISFVTFFNEDQFLEYRIIEKNASGWAQVSSFPNYKHLVAFQTNSGAVYVKEIHNKTVLYFMYLSQDITIPYVTDSECSAFLTTSAISDEGLLFVYGLLVLDTPLPKGYSLTVGEETVHFE